METNTIFIFGWLKIVIGPNACYQNLFFQEQQN